MGDGFKQFVVIFVASFLLWLLLVGHLTAEELIAGAMVSSIAVIFALEKSALLSGIKLDFLAPLSLLAYLGVFLVALVRANIDMARRVLSPSLPINPAMVRVKTALQSDLGKLMLANSITLTPGTLSIDVEGDEIIVHWIDCPEDVDTGRATEIIAESFEKHLRGFLK